MEIRVSVAGSGQKGHVECNILNIQEPFQNRVNDSVK